MRMSLDQYERINQEKRQRRLLDEHLRKFQSRLERDDLSALELQDLREQKLAESYDAPESTRQRLHAELNLLDSMVSAVDPEPTMEEQIAGYRANGLRDIADGLEHAMQTVRTREEIDRLQMQLMDSTLPSYQRSGIESTLRNAQERLDKLDSFHPVHARENKVSALRADAQALDEQLSSFQPEGEASRRLYSELTEKRDAALEQAQGIEDGILTVSDDGSVTTSNEHGAG